MLKIKIFILIFLMCNPFFAQASTPDWVETSNKHAQLVLKVLAKYAPETAGQYGLEGYDEAIADLKPRVFERQQADSQQLIQQLTEVLEKEQHPKVRQDLMILLDSVKSTLETSELGHKLTLPHYDVTAVVFGGISSLLSENVDPSQHAAAVVRLKKYAGLASTEEPLTALAKARTTERLENAELVGPFHLEVRQSLASSEAMLQGVAALMKQYKLTGWEEAHAKLVAQIKDYNAWVESTVLPRARQNHQLPAEIYANNLKSFGVKIEPQELMERARFGYMEIRNEMTAMAKRIAADRDWKISSYHDVIRKLKEDQLDEGEILNVYRKRLESIEAIIRREDIVSLPKREAKIRLATDAESAASPSPRMQPPPMIGNTGQSGEFLIPLRNANAASSDKMDDFLNDAITWSLTAHEARPGHEMQFAAMLENGVSIPRMLFAFNSANVEGWGMYAEAIMKEYYPLEGQFFALHSRLLRAARAFLDPMVNLGMLEPKQVKQFLMKELLLSEPMAAQEVDRYTFNAPGQATSYYYGLMKMESLRVQVELLMGDEFNQRAYHDFILKQGLLPPELLTEAVMQEFVKTTESAVKE